ncbi:AAA family ATPase [uncultured Jatrophihabitans sp.]|uniref:AAA family ATPase n=1 Tax=uncultured Jatrophihabitans sp. TaxID=1610747 RepID=UPI0035CB5BD2
MTAPVLRTTALADVREAYDDLECITYKSIPLHVELLHALVGEGEAGKTWIAVHAVLDVLLREPVANVLVLDGEMNAQTWRRRLIALGATDDHLAHVHYGEMTDDAASTDLVIATCEALRVVSLVVWDSALSMLSRTARSENDNAEVSRVYDRLREIVRRARVAGLIVDHTTRGSSALISRGATAKFNALDISYGVRIADGCVPGPIEPWSSIVSVEKDRHGLLGKRADREAAFFPLSDGRLELSITERDAATHRLSPDNPVTTALAKITALDPAPTSGNDAYKQIGGNRQVCLKAFKLWKEQQ